MPEIAMTIEEIVNVFVPGVVCIFVYDMLANKKYKLQTYTVAGIIVGMIIKSVMDGINSLFLLLWCLPIPMFPFYIVCAIFVGARIYLTRNSLKFRTFMIDVFNVDPGDNFWVRNIDLVAGTFVIIYTIDGKVVFGDVQSVDDDYITLLKHETVSEAYSDEMTIAMDCRIDETIMCVPQKNISRFEIMYKHKNDFSKLAFR